MLCLPPPLTGQSILEISDPPPPGDKTIYIKENTLPGNEIFTMTVNYDNGGALVYALVPSGVSEYIELIDNGNQTTLKLKKALDFEVRKQVLFSVR